MWFLSFFSEPPISWWLIHGSLNVPIFHITQPWMVYGLLDGYFFRWCPIFPKWDRQTNPWSTDWLGSHYSSHYSSHYRPYSSHYRPYTIHGWVMKNGDMTNDPWLMVPGVPGLILWPTMAGHVFPWKNMVPHGELKWVSSPQWFTWDK